jgi:hypothetical protein
LLLAGGIAAVLAGIVIGVLVFSGGEEQHEFDPAPAACIEGWNDDPATLVVGQHQATAHRYSEVQVVRFSSPGVIAPTTDTTSPCGIVFASSSLDTELAAAALVQRPKAWTPLSKEEVPSETLSDLQLGAQDSYNAVLQVNGTLDPL